MFFNATKHKDAQMSDFYTSVDMLRSQVSDMLYENQEQLMWVLADLSQRCEATELHEHIDAVEADPQEVAQFFRDMADLIDAGLEADAA